MEIERLIREGRDAFNVVTVWTQYCIIASDEPGPEIRPEDGK